MALKQKGQAAVTDALFLLVIVVGISSLLYLFSSNYGFGTSAYLTSHYESDFATAAIKTILFTSVPHLAEADIKETKEIDYLVTSVKQSYSAENSPTGRYLDDETFFRLRDRIRQVLKPMETSKDYLFYIMEVDQARRILYLYGYLTDFSATPVCKGERIREGVPDATLNLAKRTEYFCVVKDPDSVSRVSQQAQGYVESRTGTYFGRLDAPTEMPAIPGEVFLSLWSTSCVTANPTIFMYQEGPITTMFPLTTDERHYISKSLNSPSVQTRINSFMEANGLLGQKQPIYCVPISDYQDALSTT